MIELTDTEKQIILILRSMRPKETVLISADNQGNKDKFFVKRSETFFVVGTIKIPVIEKNTDIHS